MSSGLAAHRRRAGQRAGLTSSDVLDAALRLVERRGVDQLTIRALASELGVAPNTVQSHVGSKEALLDALLDSLLGRIATPEVDPSDPAAWREGLVALMDASRRLLLDHPALVSVFMSRPTRGPNAARLGEATLRLLRQGGLDGERAVEAMRVVLIYSLGFAAFQAPRTGEDAGARTAASEAVFADLPEDEYPEMRRLAPLLSRHPTDESFLTGLRWLLDGMSTVRRTG